MGQSGDAASVPSLSLVYLIASPSLSLGPSLNLSPSHRLSFGLILSLNCSPVLCILSHPNTPFVAPVSALPRGELQSLPQPLSALAMTKLKSHPFLTALLQPCVSPTSALPQLCLSYTSLSTTSIQPFIMTLTRRGQGVKHVCPFLGE